MTTEKGLMRDVNSDDVISFSNGGEKYKMICLYKSREGGYNEWKLYHYPSKQTRIVSIDIDQELFIHH
jgi:hypothetical protein